MGSHFSGCTGNIDSSSQGPSSWAMVVFVAGCGVTVHNSKVDLFWALEHSSYVGGSDCTPGDLGFGDEALGGLCVRRVVGADRMSWISQICLSLRLSRAISVVFYTSGKQDS